MAKEDAQPLTFISGDTRSGAAREAIRVHVTRRQHRQRKQRQQELDTVYTTNQSFQVWTSPDLGSRTPRSNALIADPVERPPSGGSFDIPPYTPSFSNHVSSCGTSGNSLLPMNCTSVAGNERPNDNLEVNLVRYYLQFGGGSSITKVLYHAYSQTAATYNAFLATVAAIYSADKGEPLLVDTIDMENLALREVANQLSRSPSAPASDTMLTVALLANLREFQQEHELVGCHWGALRQMIGINGGIGWLRTHQALYSFLLWMEAVVLSKVEASISSDAGGGSAEPRSSRLEMLEFFTRISRQLQLSKTSGVARPSTISAQIVTCLSTSAHKHDLYSTCKWHHARLVSLVYLATLSLQDTLSSGQTTVQQEAEAEVLDCQQRYTVYPDELVYILIRACNQDDRCSISWTVARICCAIKRLERSGQHTCYRLLTEYLSYDDPFAFDLTIQEWDTLSATLSRPG